jgi:hypothetical protein
MTMKKKETELAADMPMDDFFAELERKHNAPWPERLWYFRGYYLHWPWNTIKETHWRLINFWQRGHRGWATSDVWYMDMYLAEMISEMLLYLAEHHYGVPLPFSTNEENLDKADERWTTYLSTLALAFHDYKEYMNESPEDKGNVLFKELIERMRPLFDHYNTLGD